MPETRGTPTEDERAHTPSWAQALVRWLDHYGLDALAGFLFPVVGDAVTGVGSMALLVLAIRKRVPTVVIARMLLNILVDTLLGAFPIVGDLFDLVWRSNRRNLDLIERYEGGKEKPSAGDYALVGIGYGLIALGIALPFLVLGALGTWIGSLFS